MKFNWRANWELLLVLLIVSVVIVIATLAAIKNKDKTLLALPDESEFGGQLTLEPANGSSASVAANQQQLFEAGDLAHPHEPPPPPTPSVHSGVAGRNEHQRGGQQVATNSRLLVPADADFGPRPTSSNFDDSPSSEPNTISQIRSYASGRPPGWPQAPSLATNQQQQQRRNTLASGFAPVARHQQPNSTSNQMDELYGDNQRHNLLQRPAELADDIHTTRSSLADDYSRYQQHQQQHQQQRQGYGANQSAGSDDDRQLQWLNTALLNNLVATMPQQPAQVPSEPADQQQQQQQVQKQPKAGLAGSLPISMLFSDLLKLARPATGGSQDQQQRPAQAAGILQQLRSLPSPLSALLASLAPGNQQQQQQQQLQQHHEHQPSGHDASESNQHYQQMPLLAADIHGILARSMRSSSVLPAFPAPKDSFDGWLAPPAPNAGGRADYHSSSNLNADFVASNTAGFMRNTAAAGQTMPAERVQQQDQQQQVQPKQRHTMSAALRNHVDPLAPGEPDKSLEVQQQQLFSPDGWPPGQQQQVQVQAFAKPNQFVQQTLPAEQQAARGQQEALGYQQPAPSYHHQHHHQQQQQQVFAAQQLPQPQSQQVHKPLDFRAQQKLIGQQQQQTGLSRRKRSQESPSDAAGPPEEDDVDSAPLSVLSPDGRPVGPARRHRQQHPLRHSDAGGQLETAGSGLMSKLLLGTESANTSDEFDDEPDEDDSLDDFGDKKRRRLLSGGGAKARSGARNQRGAKKKLLESLADDESLKPPAKSLIRKQQLAKKQQQLASAAPSDRESFARQQRSDIDFYGHPGEETRQLKFGILGSGNYEVVNGGVYSDTDESAAAVNSVANYVRRPGRFEPVGAQAAFLPGARLRASSKQLAEEQLLNLVGSHDSPAPQTASQLMDFIYGGGGAIASLSAGGGGSPLSQLGSSTRSVHASKNDQDQGQDREQDDDRPQARPATSKRLQLLKSRRLKKQQHIGDYNDMDSSSENQSVVRGAKSAGANQFQSYHLLPSKKVSIFSEKDLDSAPSELTTTTTTTAALATTTTETTTKATLDPKTTTTTTPATTKQR